MTVQSLFFNDDTISSLYIDSLELLGQIRYWLSWNLLPSSGTADIKLFGFTSYFVVELPNEKTRDDFEKAFSAYIDVFYHSYLDVLKENKGKR